MKLRPLTGQLTNQRPAFQRADKSLLPAAILSVNYVACRTKWRLATGAYRLAEMLDADWSVDLSVDGASLIWRKVNCMSQRGKWLIYMAITWK